MIAIKPRQWGTHLKKQLVLGSIALSLLLSSCAATRAETGSSAGVATSSGEAAVPSPTASASAVALPMQEWKFYDADGSFRSVEKVISDTKLPPRSPDYDTPVEQYAAIFERIESAVNYFPDEKTVRADMNVPAEKQLAAEDYYTVAAAYQKAVFDTVISGAGELRTMVDEIGKNTTFYHGRTIGFGDKELYKVTIKQDILNKQRVTISDNGEQNHIGANGSSKSNSSARPHMGEFRYTSPMDDLVVPQVPLNVDPKDYEPTYQIAGSVKLIEMK